jgi:hypothetical protein
MQLRKRNFEQDKTQAFTKKPIIDPMKTNPEDDIESLKTEYANNPQALSALDEYFNNSNTLNEKTVYSSYFFRKDIIENFTEKMLEQIPADKKDSFPLSSYKLYNADDILENITQRGTFKTRFTNESPQYQTLKNANMIKLITFLSTKVCSDIGDTYASDAVSRTLTPINKTNKFDIIVLSNKNIETIGLVHDSLYDSDKEEEEDDNDDDEEYLPKTSEPNVSMNDILVHRLSGVVGFIIVERGECKTYPYGYSINLICANKKAPQGSGSILMGLYLYTILCHPDKIPTNRINYPRGKGTFNISDNAEEDTFNTKFVSSEPLIPVQQYGILELANAYINPGGLCMYEKFGFQFTENMYGKQCFEDVYNLPMLIDFNAKPGYAELTKNQKQEKIISITSGTDRGFPKSAICSIRNSFVDSSGKEIKTNDQLLLGYLKSLKILIMHSMEYVVSDENFNKLFYTLKFINEPLKKSIIPNETTPEPSQPGNIDDYIHYLETPPNERTSSNIDRNKLLKLINVIPKSKKSGGTKKIKTKKINKTKKNKKRTRKHTTKQRRIK